MAPDPLEGFCYSNVANLTRVGGIYLQVYNRQEAWAVDDPPAFLSKLLDAVAFGVQGDSLTLSTSARPSSTPTSRPSSENSSAAGKFLNPQPSTLNLQPATFNPQPSTLNPQPATCNLQHSILNPHPSTLNPQSSLLNPQHSTLSRGQGVAGGRGGAAGGAPARGPTAGQPQIPTPEIPGDGGAARNSDLSAGDTP